MTMNKVIVAAAAVLLSAGMTPVSAADIAPASTVLSPARAATWTGFYAGVNAGYAFGTADTILSVSSATLPFSSDYDGFVGGVQLGYNWQAGPAVFGFEVDLQYADASGSALLPTTTVTAKNALEWFGTARGRLGIAFDRVMPYVTGGFAFGKNKLEIHDVVSGTRVEDTATHRGWTFGGGVEIAVRENWSAKFEYLHVDLGEKNNYLADIIGGTGSALKPDLKFGLARAGLNYRF